MKRVVVLLIMLLHLNVALIPHLDEVDIYNPDTGSQVDDINSIYEWVSVVLGIDTTVDDEDDDKANDSQITFNYITTCPQLLDLKDFIHRPNFCVTNKRKFVGFLSCQIKSISFDIESPPPEA